MSWAWAWRLLLVATIAHVATACDRVPAAGEDGGSELRLAIENASGEGLRCVVVLAHFVTRDLPAIAVGTRLEIAFERGADGSLAYISSGGRAMLVENLLCGADSRWTATARDLPLLALRSGGIRQHRFRCTPAGATLACAP